MDLSEFKEHFRIADKPFQAIADKVTPADFIKTISMCCGSWDYRMSSIGLCYYIDDYGDFTEKRNGPDLIANAMFESLDNHGKVDIMLYLNWYHGNEEDDEEDEEPQSIS